MYGPATVRWTIANVNPLPRNGEPCHIAHYARLGFDAKRVPKVSSCLDDAPLPVTRVRELSDVRIGVVESDGVLLECGLGALRAEQPFLAHSGWRGHIEAMEAGEVAPCAE